MSASNPAADQSKAPSKPSGDGATGTEPQVLDFTNINNQGKRVEMKEKKAQPSSGAKAELSDYTIQGEEREQLLRNGNEDNDLVVQQDGNRGRLQEQDAAQVKKHWLWDNWILLAMGAMLSFTICNVFIGEISALGPQSVHYFCSGSLLFSILYFIGRAEWSRKNGEQRGMLDGEGQAKKVLLRTWDNRFDWWSAFIVLIGACFQSAIYISIVMTFKVAIMAGLNIGIAQAIWAINPFFISILERVAYGTAFNFKQIYGMLALVLCAIFVSLSEVFGPADPEAETQIIPGVTERFPVWGAVLVSFCMPICCTLFVLVIKHTNETLNIAAYDFTIAYWGVASLIYQILGVVTFTQDEGSFDWGLWVNGFLASLFNLVGCVFALSCFSTGAPIGPASALICTQTILVVIIAAIQERSTPSGMQIVGLLLGLLGALLLTIPKELYAIWYRLTRCAPVPEEKAAQKADAVKVADPSL